MHMTGPQKKKLLARLARVAGQVAAIRRMVEQDMYCVDVLVQTSAARGALGRIAEIILQNHVETCVASAFRGGDETARATKIEELVDVFRRFSGVTRK